MSRGHLGCPGSAGNGVPPLFLSEYGNRAHPLVSALRAGVF
jgi:hypothetical protein